MPEAAAKSDKPTDAAEAPRKASPGAAGGSKAVPALLGLNSLLLAAVLALVVLRTGHPADKGAADEASGKEAHGSAKARDGKEGKEGKDGKVPGPMMKLPDFVVHLRDADADHYARMALELELKDEKAKEEVTSRLPVIRDAFLVYLSDRTADDLRGGEAVTKLKAALWDKLKEVLPGLPANALYVTEMVVQ